MSIIIKGDLLKTFVKAVTAVVDDCRLRLTPDGIRVRAIDAGLVSMVIVNIPKESFDIYDVQKEEIYGIDLVNVQQVLNTIPANGLVELRFENRWITFRSGAMEYSRALLDPEAIRKEPEDPKITLPAEAMLFAGRLKKAIEAAMKVDDSAYIISSKEGLRMSVKGDTEELTISLESLEMNKAEAISAFSLDILSRLLKVANTDDIVTIKLGNTAPAVIEFSPHGGKMSVKYIVAPKVLNH